MVNLPLTKARLTAIGMLLSGALIVGPAPARADVIPVKLLFHTLDNTPQLERVLHPPRPIRNWRFYTVKGGHAGGFVAPEYDDYGFLRTGADLLIVPLESGGSGGIFDALLFTGLKKRPHFIGYVPSVSGHLLIRIAAGTIEVTTPNYGPRDPNCCPSSETDTRYTLDGIRLKKIDERTTNPR